MNDSLGESNLVALGVRCSGERAYRKLKKVVLSLTSLLERPICTNIGQKLESSTCDDLPTYYIIVKGITQRKRETLTQQLAMIASTSAADAPSAHCTIEIINDNHSVKLPEVFCEKLDEALIASQIFPSWMPVGENNIPLSALLCDPINNGAFPDLLLMPPPQLELVGIVNVTPDSFSEGGAHYRPDQAITHSLRLVEEGATILDIGAESTHRYAEQVGSKEELWRLRPVLEGLEQQRIKERGVKLSIDTYHPETARQLLREFSIDWINDVSGLSSLEMLNVVADCGGDLVIMHSLRVPHRRTHMLEPSQDVVEVVMQWGNKILALLERYGFSSKRVILDPGIGWGKNALQSLALLKNIDALKNLGVRLLLGHSRKSFLRQFHPQSTAAERDVETAVISAQALAQSVDYLRVHNVEMQRRTLVASHGIMLDSHRVEAKRGMP